MRAPTASVARGKADVGEIRLEVSGLCADDADGQAAVRGVSFTVRGGEIVGIAGVSGNGQSELVEVLAGQRDATAGFMQVHGETYRARRKETQKHRLRPAARRAVAQRLRRPHERRRKHGFPQFRSSSLARGFWLGTAGMRARAKDLIQRYRVKTPSPDAPIATLSGGNVQRAVLARELGHDVDVLVAANPVFGLDFAAVADIHAQIVAARNRGAAVLLVSEDLDELLELSDRILVMSDGEVVFESPIEMAERTAVGRAMAGHAEAHG